MYAFYVHQRYRGEKKGDRKGIFCMRTKHMVVVACNFVRHTKLIPLRRAWLGAVGRVIGAAWTKLGYWGRDWEPLSSEKPNRGYWEGYWRHDWRWSKPMTHRFSAKRKKGRVKHSSIPIPGPSLSQEKEKPVSSYSSSRLLP